MFVFAFRDRRGDIVQGFVAAPMTYDSPGMQVYGATWVGPQGAETEGAAEIAVAFHALSN